MEIGPATQLSFLCHSNHRDPALHVAAYITGLLVRMIDIPIRLSICLPQPCCCSMQIRIAKHPCSSTIIRLAAATEASDIKTWSEAGRLWGLACRKELFHCLFKRFDWFCGLSYEIVAAEKARGFWRFIACIAGCWAALSAVALLRWPGFCGSSAPHSDYISVVHVLTACAAVISCCCHALWRLEG